MRFAGKVLFVTGAGSGIGAAVARGYAASGGLTGTNLVPDGGLTAA